MVIEVSGNFSLATQNFVLEAQDGGTGPDAPVVVRAGASGAVITGGMRCRRRVSAR